MMATWGKTLSAAFCEGLKERVANSTLGGTRTVDDFDIDQVFAIGEDGETALNVAMQKQMNASAVGDRRSKALGLLKASDALAIMGKHKEARDQAAEAASLCQELGFEEGVIAAKGVLAKTTGSNDRDELEDAQSVAIDCLKGSQKMSFKMGEANAYATQATIYQQLGEADKSIACAKLAMGLYSELGKEICVAEMFLSLCKAFIIKKDITKAAKRVRKAVEMCNKVGDKATEAKCMHIAAMVELAGNDMAKGSAALDEAGQMYLSVGNLMGYSDVMDTKIDLHMEQKQTTQAVGVAKAKVKQCNASNDMKGEATAMASLGSLFLTLGEHDKANKVAEVAMGMFAGMNDIEGMKNTKDLIDGAKHAQEIEEIAVAVEQNKDYMHVPEGLIIDPGMAHKIVTQFQEAVSRV